MSADPMISYFDGVADIYDEVLPFFTGFAARVAEVLDPAGGTEALDVAAGRGALTGALTARGCYVTAVDGSPRMTALLARDHPEAEAHTMDAGRLGFGADEFDLAVCGFAMHIVADPRAALAEMSRVVKPGGRLALTVPGRADDTPDPWDDPMVDLFAEYRRFTDRRTNDADLADLLAGLRPEATTLEVAIPVPDAATYWRWCLSHGAGRFIGGLPEDKRAEMRARLDDTFPPGFVLRRSATLWIAYP